jgi:hypothetical protein
MPEPGDKDKPKVAFPKQKVKCPECGDEIEIFIPVSERTDNSGICRCGVDVEAVHRTARYQELATKVRKEKEPPKPKRSDPFSFSM